MKILQCDSKGDRRFSAFYAKVEVFGKNDSIENHYQLSKRIYGQDVPKYWRDMKGKEITHFEVGGKLFPKEYLSEYYKLLWIKYFDKNPELLEYASGFDDFIDIFKGNSINCQADVIESIVKFGRNQVLYECNAFIKLLSSKDDLMIIEGDLLKSKQDIIGHQVNCMGVMGSGIAKAIKEKPLVFSKYQRVVKSTSNPIDLLGKCQVVEFEDGRYVANIFGQINYGRDKTHTNYEALKKSLIDLKQFAIERNLSIALPYNIGCGLAGGDWSTVSEILGQVFSDYPLILYRLN